MGLSRMGAASILGVFALTAMILFIAEDSPQEGTVRESTSPLTPTTKASKAIFKLKNYKHTNMLRPTPNKKAQQHMLRAAKVSTIQEQLGMTKVPRKVKHQSAPHRSRQQMLDEKALPPHVVHQVHKHPTWLEEADVALPTIQEQMAQQVHHRGPSPHKAAVKQQVAHLRYRNLVTGERSMRKRIGKALLVATKSLSNAHSHTEQKLAKIAVVHALKSVGVAEPGSAGEIAWANRNLDEAKEWAMKALKKDASALDRVDAWRKGDRHTGLRMRRAAEAAGEKMLAVASVFKNKEAVVRDEKHHAAQDAAAFNMPIKNAKKAGMYARKSLEHARAALRAPLGTEAQKAAQNAQRRAKSALRDANMIMKLERQRQQQLIQGRLHQKGLKLISINELHFQATKTFHRANRVAKLVHVALGHARRNHAAHMEAVNKRMEKLSMEKSSKTAQAERVAKQVAKKKQRIAEAKKEYSQQLQEEAERFGELAKADAEKAAKAGKIAAQKAMASVQVRQELGQQAVPQMELLDSLARENIAADLATKASQMEDAVVSGQGIPQAVKEVLMDDSGTKMRPAVQKIAAAVTNGGKLDGDLDEDFHAFMNHRAVWNAHYDRLYHDHEAGIADRRQEN